MADNKEKHSKKLKNAHMKEHHNIIHDIIPDDNSAIEALDEKLEKERCSVSSSGLLVRSLS